MKLQADYSLYVTEEICQFNYSTLTAFLFAFVREQQVVIVKYNIWQQVAIKLTLALKNLLFFWSQESKHVLFQFAKK